MRKLTPIGNRILVTSRGVKEQTDGGVIVPAMYLADSDICTTESGETVVIRRGSGKDVGDRRKIVNLDDVIARIVDDEYVTEPGWLLLRKCLDPVDQSGLVSISDRKNQFGEVLAGGNRFGIQDASGWMAYVKENTDPQRVEESEDDWLVHEDDIKFFCNGDAQ